jgi:predicted DNA binding CopG/RHH family protein
MDKRVNLRLSEKIGTLLHAQADENGMNLSAYISHLILQVEQTKENKALINNMINKMPQLDLHYMAKLIKGDDYK